MYQILRNPVGTSRNTGFSSGGRSISLISQSLGWKVCRGSKSASFMARRLIGVLRDVERAKQVGVLLLGSRLSLYFLPSLAKVDYYKFSYFGHVL